MSTFFIIYNLLNHIICFTARWHGRVEKSAHVNQSCLSQVIVVFHQTQPRKFLSTFSATRSLLTPRNVSILDQTLIKTKLKCQKFNIEVFVFLLRLISESRCHVSILEQKSFSIKPYSGI